MEKTLRSLTLFFPCYNDRETIGGLVEAADHVARELTGDYEILVIDDGSTDGSRELLQTLKSTFPALRLVFHEINRGYGAAVTSGFNHALKEWIFYTDGDGQYDPADLRALAMLAAQHECINGVIMRRGDSALRVLTGALYRHFCRLAFRVHFYDINCDFRLIRAAALRKIRLTVTTGALGLELIARLEREGYYIQGCPVRHLPRPHGKSQFFKPVRLFKTAADLFRLWLSLR
jgi:glycosyltransferase involved in cell wall biosynthesis